MGDFLNFSHARFHATSRVLLDMRRKLRDANCYVERGNNSHECARMWNAYWEYAISTPHYGQLRAEHEQYCQRIHNVVPDHCIKEPHF